jgi:NADPH-dependent 2,4-dienoyl-CoA reductase/sulfur reductase-like enzyme
LERKKGVKVHVLHRAEKLLPQQKTAVIRDLNTGRIAEELYDKLVISTGAEPIVPPGINTSGSRVFTLRGLSSAQSLKRFIRESSPKEALIVGGGYIGLEMAGALAASGIHTTIVEFMPRVIPAMEEEISEMVSRELESHGIDIITGVGVEKVAESSGGKVEAILTNGNCLNTDIVLVAIGVKPRTQLAAEAGLELGVKGAIKVNRQQRTSLPDIWAGGDCAEAYHRLLQRNTYVPLALTANRQGRIIGESVAGRDSVFPGILGTAVSKVFDLTVARTGLGEKEAQSYGYKTNKVVATSRSHPAYYPGSQEIQTVLVLEQGSSRLLGVQMVGKEGVAQRIDVWATALTAGFSLSQIHDLDLAYAPPFSTVWGPVLLASRIAMKSE